MKTLRASFLRVSGNATLCEIAFTEIVKSRVIRNVFFITDKMVGTTDIKV
jgi:hypothetical protein